MAYLVMGNVSSDAFARHLDAYEISVVKFYDGVGRYAIEEYCERKNKTMNILSPSSNHQLVLKNVVALIVCVKSVRDISTYSSIINSAEHTNVPYKVCI